MISNDLLDAIGEVPDEYIADTKSAKKRRMPRWAKWSCAAAACLVAAVGIGGVLQIRGGINGGSAGGMGHADGSSFMHYAGPVFPLTLLESNPEISATRDITMDFAPWIPVWISNEEEAASHPSESDRQEILDQYNEWYPEGGYYQYSGNIIVKDSYILENGGAQNQTVHVLYPFASSLKDLNNNIPSLTVNGEVLETTLHAGSYAGGFEGAWGGSSKELKEGSVNLAYIENWEGYRSFLSDGTYMDRALGDFVDLSDIPVTVYEFSDVWGTPEDDKAGIPNPTIRVMFDLDYEKTQVLSYGFNGSLWDEKNGIMGKEFSIRRQGESDYGRPYYIIVVGEDIQNVDYKGYVTGGWGTEKTIDAGMTISRRESNLEEALRAVAEYRYQTAFEMGYFESDYDYGFELYFGLLKEHLMAYSSLSGNGVQRYEDGAIENMDVVGVSRVFWLEAEVTIPADSYVTVEAVSEKEPSYDFYCSNTENRKISGYDMVTRLGSNLTFTGQTAKLEDRGQIEIVRQNFGFDIENGVNEVELDIEEPHYYLEVKPVIE